MSGNEYIKRTVSTSLNNIGGTCRTNKNTAEGIYLQLADIENLEQIQESLEQKDFEFFSQTYFSAIQCVQNIVDRLSVGQYNRKEISDYLKYCEIQGFPKQKLAEALQAVVQTLIDATATGISNIKIPCTQAERYLDQVSVIKEVIQKNQRSMLSQRQDEYNQEQLSENASELAANMLFKIHSYVISDTDHNDFSDIPTATEISLSYEIDSSAFIKSDAKVTFTLSDLIDKVSSFVLEKDHLRQRTIKNLKNTSIFANHLFDSLDKIQEEMDCLIELLSPKDFSDSLSESEIRRVHTIRACASFILEYANSPACKSLLQPKNIVEKEKKELLSQKRDCLQKGQNQLNLYIAKFRPKFILKNKKVTTRF